MNLLYRISSFCNLKKMPITRFGKEAVGDPNFVRDLRNGRSIKAKTLEKVERYMNDQR